MTNTKLAASIGVAVAGSIIFGWTWSTFRIGNEIKWLNENKAYVCSRLANQQQALHARQKEVLKHTYDEGTANAIIQAFLGTVMTTLAVERQTVNDTQLRYGCAMPTFKSNTDS
jgi:hypothetical protein